jgi:hypothetical protein
MEDEHAAEPTNLAAIAQKLGELAARLHDLAQQPLVAALETDLPAEVADAIVPDEAVVVPAGSL